MHTENAILMHADVGTIYALAAAVERWPKLLPHYRWVRVLERHGDRRVVEMAARRGRIPVRWVAEQRCEPATPRITFHHVRGATAGMDVEWTFDRRPEGVLVTIRHDLQPRWPLVGGLVADCVIGPWFVEQIAGQTLGRIKELAESLERAGAPRER